VKPYLLVAGDFTKTGGMDGANYALASYLADCGREVHLAALRAEADLLSRPNVVVHRIRKPGGSYFLAEPLLDRAGRRCASGIAGRGGRVVVNGGNCQWSDINWVHYVHAAYEPEGKLKGLRRLKARASRWRFLYAERRVIQRARVVIANSERTRRDITTKLHLPESRVCRVYYGIDGERFGPITSEERARARAVLGLNPNSYYAVFIGALGDERKGFDTVFSAWKILCAERDWDINLVVVGRGAQLVRWRSRAADAGLEARIRFLGFRSDVANVLAACDVLVAPARYEAYGRGVQEALCRGLPAFVSRDSGVAEHYPASLQELLISDPGDAGDLCARLRRWRRSVDAYREAIDPLSRQLRARTWDRMAAEMIEFAESVR